MLGGCHLPRYLCNIHLMFLYSMILWFYRYYIMKRVMAKQIRSLLFLVFSNSFSIKCTKSNAKLSRLDPWAQWMFWASTSWNGHCLMVKRFEGQLSPIWNSKSFFKIGILVSMWSKLMAIFYRERSYFVLCTYQFSVSRTQSISKFGCRL